MGAYATADQLSEEAVKPIQSATAAATEKDASLMEQYKPWWHQLLVPSYAGTVTSLGSYAETEQLPPDMVEYINTCETLRQKLEQSGTSLPLWYQLLVPSYAGTVTSLGSYAATEQLPPDMVEYINKCEALRQKLEQSGISLPLWYQLLVPSYAGTVTSLGSYADTEQLPPDMIEYIKVCDALRQKLEQSGDNSLPLWYQLLVPSHTGTVTSLGSYAATEQLPPDMVEYINKCEALRQQLEQSGISLPLPLWYKLLVPSDFGTGATLGAYITPEQHSDMMKKMALKKGKSIHELTLEDFNEFVEESLHASNPFNQISIDCQQHMQQLHQLQHQHQAKEDTEVEEGTEVGKGSEVEEHSDEAHLAAV